MTGIAALAAAAAATPKINTNTPGGIKVVTPTVVTPQGVRVTPVRGESGAYSIFTWISGCMMVWQLIVIRYGFLLG